MRNSDTDTKKAAIYRYYSDKSVLLYIGVSTNPWLRAYQHGIADEVDFVTLEWFDDRVSAEVMESFYIATENPVWNKRRVEYTEERLNNLFGFVIERFGKGSKQYKDVLCEIQTR